MADPSRLATELVAASIPAQPRQLGFAWSLNESGSRLSGKGAVRYAAPERIRLDLFGPRNETYLAAALVGEQFRLPGAMPPAVALPSPALLWGALGVIRPPTGTTLTEALATDSTASLRYRAASGEVFLYRTARVAGATRLAQLERIGSSGVLESVRLEFGPAGEHLRTRYRDWTAFRDLSLDLESSRDVASFPESIWTP